MPITPPESSPSSPASRSPLVSGHAGLPDDRTPLLDFRLEESAERLGRDALEGRGLGAELGEARAKRRVLHGAAQGGIELVERGLRRAARREEAIPHYDVEALERRVERR